MFRKDIANFILKNEDSIVYVGASNKNIDMYFEEIVEQKTSDFNIIKLDDLQEEEVYFKLNYELIESLKSDKKLVLLTSVEGFLTKYSFNNDILTLTLGVGIGRKDLAELLEKNGYRKNYLVENRMEFSVRGDILDIFPMSGENPVRIEFFGDEIDRISYFSIFDQKSLEKLSSINMYINKNNSNTIDFMKIVESIEKTRKCQVFLENSEILEYKLEEIILRDRDRENEIKKLYEQLKGKAIELEVIKSDGDTEKTRPIKSKQGVRYENIAQIREGDYIIHENYGVGLYMGIQEIDGYDYLAIKYAGEDKLFVPIENLNKIERFLSTPGKVPSLYNLGRRGFKNRRLKLEEDMIKFAKEIVEIQARRVLHIGYKFSPDTVWQEEFEERFPYVETRDQKNAIMDVKRDMESGRIMDRVVCGDVGYGKTEVAIRAAFKCVMDGKQVLILAPTTVLAEQHYELFKKRYEEYPITIEILSRLSGVIAQKETIKRMEDGTVDILIGTHRILSGDVRCKDLGLIIVDEEQKFGVKDKEKLKKMKKDVDMLTLTATPIPRTLNYALLGIRDISVIETAPEGRVPVETQFIDDDKAQIREAIMKEISREGQVFYIFNRVKRLQDKLDELKKNLPKFVTIDYIHGQLPAQSIKNKLKKFQEGDIDILLSTTIIENGIDIENANTILIEGVDKLGLSQVYQLRGRVGRGKRKGHCYLILNKDKQLGRKASERNSTLKEIGEFGGGFKLSLEDMRIRGAGEILGDKQHGALETFGYNFYTKLLQEEVAKIKGEYKEDFETRVILKEKSYLPKEYVEGNERLVIYRRMVEMRDIESLNEMRDELKDRFGILPIEVINLLRYLEIKILAKDLKIREIVEKDEGYLIRFDNDYMNFDKIMDLIEAQKARYSKKDEGLYYIGDILEFLCWYEREDNIQ